MSDAQSLLVSTAGKLFEANASVEDVRSAGLDRLLTEGGDWSDAWAVARTAGFFAWAGDASALILGEPPCWESSLLTAAMMAGALDAALALSVDHAKTRHQFGKPLARFQTVQQSLAVMSSHIALTDAAGEAAAAAMAGGDGGLEIAAAKLTANRAAAIGISTAHQVHGAIGFTVEHPLHRLTSRLSVWRGTLGNDRLLADELSRALVKRGADNFWADLTARSDAGYAP